MDPQNDTMPERYRPARQASLGCQHVFLAKVLEAGYDRTERFQHDAAEFAASYDVLRNVRKE